MEEFAAGRPGSPNQNLGCAGFFRLVDFADERGEDMGGVEVEIVMRPVEIGGHGGEEILSVFAGVGLAELDAGDLGDGVGVVGGLERAGEEGVFADGLGGELGVDTGTAEEEELGAAEVGGGFDEVVLEGEIFEEEFDGLFGIRHDAAHARGGVDDKFGAFFFKKGADCGAVEEVEFGAGAGEDLGEALAGEGADDGAANHAAVAGDEDFRVGCHSMELTTEDTEGTEEILLTTGRGVFVFSRGGSWKVRRRGRRRS